MELNTILLILCAVMLIALIVLVIMLLSRRGGEREALLRIDELKRDMEESQRLLRAELSETTRRSVGSMGELISQNQRALGDSQEKSLASVQRAVFAMAEQIEKRLATSAAESERKLESIRATVEKRLESLQSDNSKKLDEMRAVVDEKLQKTLEERMTQSFKLVNDRREQVYKGLGEMQNLAVGVGDLKRVLSNVKTRGILGEIQLGAILEDIMAPEQYECNVVTVKNSRAPVEFAIKLPAEDDSFVYLPIDSKFPIDAYTALLDAYESGAPEQVKAASDALKQRVRGFAKDIHEKYVSPPETTEFAVMFLPTEGLYAEVVKLGLVESLQSEFRVNVAGPSTMAALLNSLQMGFRTVAIQKRSGEVWKVLGAVKTEFTKFEGVLQKAQKRILLANNDLDALIGTRTRSIQRSLREVTMLPQSEANAYIPEETSASALDEGGDEGDNEI